MATLQYTIIEKATVHGAICILLKIIFLKRKYLKYSVIPYFLTVIFELTLQNLLFFKHLCSLNRGKSTTNQHEAFWVIPPISPNLYAVIAFTDVTAVIAEFIFEKGARRRARFLQ